MMSGEARGKFGRILVFKKRLSTNVVCRYFIPRNPRSAGQTTSRARTTAAVARWKAALEATQTAWNTYSKAFRRVGYNMYCSGFIAYMRDNAEAQPDAPFLP